MLKLFIIASLCLQALSVPLWGQCGGENFTGSTICDSGLSCVYINQYYSQCVPSGSATTTAPPVTGPTTQPSPIVGQFPDCKFRIGRSYDQPTTDYSKYDYVSIWINTPASDGSGTNFNIYYQGEMIKAVKRAGKIPLFYAYVIAFEARYRANLQDCDVSGSNNLCTDGSNWIRNNRALIVSRYKHQATEIANALGDRNAQAIFVMEPDYWQYYGDRNQKGGTLTGEYMRALMDDCVAEIKAALPNAIISWDISAWIGVSGMTTWWGFFKSAPYINFVHTSGGQARGDQIEIKPNELKWSEVSQITGKKIIADCGYGIGGGASDNCSPWFSNAMSDRIRDGVISLSIANPTRPT